MDTIGPEPVAEFMRERGHPPEKWDLWLPESFRIASVLPSYVKFSKLLDRPVFIERSYLEI